MSDARTVWGIGLTTIAGDGTVLDAWYPEVRRGELVADEAGVAALEPLVGRDERR
ncbi:MAG: 2,3,4,5-tetrahydropyridine-2,6-dicarboxylate N-succinyltransferase, partial [Actinobacteria bacterium HGW-Actinobacteria-11]